MCENLLRNMVSRGNGGWIRACKREVGVERQASVEGECMRWERGPEGRVRRLGDGDEHGVDGHDVEGEVRSVIGGWEGHELKTSAGVRRRLSSWACPRS